MRIHLLSSLLALSLFTACRKDQSDGTIVSNPTEGEIVLSSYANNAALPSTLFVMDKYGKTISQRSIPVAAANLQRWRVNGKTRYTYLMYDSTALRLSTTGGITPCTAIVTDQNFQEIKRVRLLPANGRTSADPSAVDSHEFIYLDDDHFITLSYYQKVVNNIPASLNPVANCKVVAPIIQEVVNGQVVWEWDGTNYPEFYTQSVEGNAFSNGNVLHDYAHMNSMFIDPTDNNLICSMRNTDQVIKISRNDGRIIWRLGGSNSDFPMTADMKFLRQHHATLTDNNKTLLLFDNGEATQRPYTRVLEFQLNTDSKQIAGFKAFTLPDKMFVQFTGSVQKRGETYFLGCGGTSKVMEVNYNNNHINFLKTLPSPCYRALKD